jgi:ribosomal protein S18 acetylase RimI-like enzyme
MANLPIRIRKATEEDVSFIFNSWLKSYRDSAFAKSITNTIYFNEHHKLLEDLLKTCNVLVACNNENPADIYGYSVTETVEGFFVLHFVYIKHTYRQLGLGKKLMQEAGADFTKASFCSHITKHGERLAAKYNMVHSPYVAFLGCYRKGGKNESNSD